MPLTPSPRPPHQIFWVGWSSRRAAGHCGGGHAGARGARGGRTALVRPLVDVASAGVHEEVADGGELQAQLLGDGDLHLFGRTAVLSEDGYQGTTLQVCEDQPLLLWHLVTLSSSVFLLTLTCVLLLVDAWTDG